MRAMRVPGTPEGQQPSGAERIVADFWFDPSCPYTWIASRWMHEVRRVRPVDVRWRVMSLSVLNEGREVDPEGDTQGWLWMPVRLCAAVSEVYGQRALGTFFTALGERIHVDGDWDWQRLFPEALTRAGLPPELADTAWTDAYDAAVRASHAEAVALVGTDVGTPVVAVDRPGGGRTAFSGPSVSPAPRGEDAGRLWDGALLMAGVPEFHELRRTAAAPDFRT